MDVPTPSWVPGEFMAISSLGVMCLAGLIYKNYWPAVLLPQLSGIVRLALLGQEHLRRVPCQGGSSAFPGAWLQQACCQGMLW